jgi:EAL domain-containing protein (putative c-di-GMP-specific phosphodiesterase class I)
MGPAPVLSIRDRTLEEAIRLDRVDIRFQPQIEPGSGRVIGVEALARWRDVASPEELFARAEASGLSERLSRAIQRKALRMAARWKRPLAGLRLSINLLPRDLERAGYDEWLLDEIAAAGLDPARITVEIVESGLVADPVVATRLS